MNKKNVFILKYFFFLVSFFLYQEKTVCFFKNNLKVLESASLWNLMPTNLQKDFFNMKKKNSFQNKLLHHFFILAPLVYTGQQLWKSYQEKYRKQSSVIELFFDISEKEYEEVKNFINSSLKKNNLVYWFTQKIIETIKQIDNNQKTFSLLNSTQKEAKFTKDQTVFFLKFWKKDLFNKLLFNFKKKIIFRSDVNDLNKLKKQLEEIEREIEIEIEIERERERERERIAIEEIEKIYICIEINKKLNKELKEKNERLSKASEKESLKKEIQKIDSEKKKNLSIESSKAIMPGDQTREKILKTLWDPIPLKEERGGNNNETVLYFLKDQSKKIISLDYPFKIPFFQGNEKIDRLNEKLKSPLFSNIFLLSFIGLNLYPLLYFSDFRNGLYPYSNMNMKNLKI